jgi:N-acetylmuramoyl-L-alanine amidase-like protein
VRSVLFSLLALAPLACGSGSGVPSNGPQGDAFASSAAAASVPRDLLVAIAQVEGGLDMVAHRDVELDNEVPAAGPLMLRHGKLDTLARAAVLSGQSELTLRQETDLALDAGAKVLAELGAKTGATDDLASWQAAIEEMSGYQDDAHRHAYAHRVFAVLASGGKLAGRDGEMIVVPAHPDIPISLTIDLDSTIHIEGAEFPGAEWFPTSCVNKCDTTRGGNAISRVVIHDTEGGWDASVATLQNDPGKSVHYIVGTDGRVGQFIPESYTGWSVGNYYYNQRTVSIEHVGYSTKPYTEKQYAASAELVKYLDKKYNVAPDRNHIIGHDQVPDGTNVAKHVREERRLRRLRAPHGSRRVGVGDVHAAHRRVRQVRRRHEPVELRLGSEARLPLRQQQGRCRLVQRSERLRRGAERPGRSVRHGEHRSAAAHDRQARAHRKWHHDPARRRRTESGELRRLRCVVWRKRIWLEPAKCGFFAARARHSGFPKTTLIQL